MGKPGLNPQKNGNLWLVKTFVISDNLTNWIEHFLNTFILRCRWVTLKNM
jgi:hypothetical protein